jgi:UDP-glucose 4-epimerase
MTEVRRGLVFVTGAAGFVGRHLCRVLADSNWVVRGGVRLAGPLPVGVETVVTGDLAEARLDLAGVDAVVHVAGLAHRRGVSPDVWIRENCAAAVNVAARAKAAGVRRFVFISTVGVFGRAVAGAVDETSAVLPVETYARAKWQAEQALRAIYGDGLVVVRPVAVVGAGCPGNLPLLMKLLGKGVPLPFGSIRNRRSFIEVTDLARLLLAVLAAEAPPALVLAAHPAPIGTPDLVRALARGMGVKVLLLPCPAGILAAGAKLAGRRAMFESLAGDFVVDPKKAALALGWRPAESLAESLAKTGAAFVVA